MQDTRGCLLELQHLASSQDKRNRDEILDRVTDLFFLTSREQGVAEREVFGSVMERIAYELESRAREQLAERLAASDRAPHKLIFRLASDEIAVARPVLEQSPCLDEADLVQIAETSGQAHLHAISCRGKLSPTVTDTLVERGNDRVLTSVAGNRGAEFSTRGLERLTVRAEGNPELFSALEVRADVPKEMLEEIKRTIAVRLWAEVTAISSGISGKEIDDIVAAKASEMNLDSPDRGIAAEPRPGRGHKVTEEMVLAFARARRQTETIQCLSLLSGMSLARISHCLLDADLTALAVLCKAHHFRNTTFAALLQLRSASNSLHVRVIAEAMRHYDLLDMQTARRTIEAVRKRKAGQE